MKPLPELLQSPLSWLDRSGKALAQTRERNYLRLPERRDAVIC
jgi:hypothetical protein